MGGKFATFWGTIPRNPIYQEVRFYNRIIYSLLKPFTSSLDNITMGLESVTGQLQETQRAILHHFRALYMTLGTEGGTCPVVRSNYCIFNPNNLPDIFAIPRKVPEVTEEVFHCHSNSHHQGRTTGPRTFGSPLKVCEVGDTYWFHL